MMLLHLAESCLIALCAVSVFYWILSTVILRRRMARRRLPADTGTVLAPVTFLRPIKACVPDLRSRVREAIGAMRPGDQLIFGVEANSQEAECCEQECAFVDSDRQILIVTCHPDGARNPKINKLVQMTLVAEHDRLIVMDSEAMPDAGWMERFREEWVGTGADLLTAGYRFGGAKSWWQRLDAAAALLTLWPGLAVVEAFGQVRFALGACMALRREDLDSLGGWARWSDSLAEDHALGQCFADDGRHVALSREVLELQSDLLDATGWWRHQRRAAVTYRVACPTGYAGQIVTHGVTFALLLTPLSGGAGWTWLAAGAVVILRSVTAVSIARTIGWRFRWLWIIAPIASLLETVFWLTACAAPQVWWAGRCWRVTDSGQLAGTPGPDSKIG